MYFTNQSQCGTSVPQWEPNNVIQLTNPSTGTITCLGYAYTCKRRCQRAIARGTISYAQSILESLATQDPMAAAKSDKLQDAAQMLLCYQHTSQLDRTVLTWISQLRSHAGSTQSYSRVNDTRDSQTHKHSATSRDALLHELLVRMLKLEKELEESKRQRQSVPQFDEEQRKQREAEREAKVKREEKEEEEVLEKRRKHAEEERKEKQRKDTEAKERAERKERERREKEKQRQQEEQQRQKAETERRTREQAQERTWPEAWSEYIGRWEAIEKSSSPNELDFPWPTKSGLLKDVTETNVRQFFLKALPLAMAADAKEENYSLMTTENKRWHTDKILSRFGSDILEGPHKDRLNMIAKSVVDLWKRAKMERKL